jgi:spore coat protein CotH
MKIEASPCLLIVLTALWAASTTGLAQPTGPGRPTDPLLSALDRDRNGELSEGEVQSASERLLQLDQNGDGQLVREELEGTRGDGRGGRPGGGGGRGPSRGAELVLVPRFDANGDGMLIGEERRAARAEVKKERGEGRDQGGEAPVTDQGKAVSLNDVEEYPGVDLYDPSVIRTFFLELPQGDWEDELADFYRTDVLVPGTLVVDGDSYPSVGVSFRGNSSFFTVSKGKKRSINLVMDFADGDQTLGGFRTLNLLNAHTDPSFLREVTYNHVARNYIPAPKANFVRVVINGEDWGIYVNSQQMNKDFTAEWFGTRQGVRWKIRAGGGARALNYNGDDPEAYKSLYEAKSNENDRAWADLIRVCRDLETIPTEGLDQRLDRILNVDRALWFLAMDNVLIDSDGYYTRGSDYMIYQEPKFGRFHLLPYDSNETFRYPGGGGRGGGTAIRVEGVQLSPFAGEENEARPLLNRLMANKNIRARYLAHVKTIVDEWFESDRLEEAFGRFHSLIAENVELDVKKLYSTEAFFSNLNVDEGTGRRSTPGLKSFVAARRDYFRGFPDFELAAPQIASVVRENYEQAPAAGESIGIMATLSGDVAADEVILYYALDRNARFKAIEMEQTAEAGVYRGGVPPMPAGSRVYFYVEARRGAGPVASQFWPRSTVMGAPSYRIVSAEPTDMSLVINEVMPSNATSARDPQGDFDDWIEIHNPTDEELDLSGMYLSDNQNDLRQWQFPNGTKMLPKGYILVWADGDVKKTRGYHAGFKLSGNGETILLVDTNERGNAIIDQFTYSGVNKDESFGRIRSGKLSVMPPTPGRENL